jgi:hypothetical protein
VTTFTSGAPTAGSLVQFVGGPDTGVATSDPGGDYVMELPAPGTYTVTVDGVAAGFSEVRDAGYRGDLLVDDGACTSRYGTVTDAVTARPVAGVTLSLPPGTSVTSGPDGWYRIDIGCEPSQRFNTTFISASHPSYVPLQRVVGRGVRHVLRLDLVLAPN